ncbi:hypothetical protein H6F89_28195 [Cyanobacteria bacterium FACHB-63]|nr:hypothetical protein [Cyanobacteria bacterium FACHB-63]
MGGALRWANAPYKIGDRTLQGDRCEVDVLSLRQFQHLVGNTGRVISGSDGFGNTPFEMGKIDKGI